MNFLGIHNLPRNGAAKRSRPARRRAPETKG